MVKPFVKYVLLHPTPSSDLSCIGQSLQSELISVATTSLLCYQHSREVAEQAAETIVALQRSKTIVNFFIKLIPMLPTKNDRQLMSVTSLLEKVVCLKLELCHYIQSDECDWQTGKYIV